MKNPAPKFIPHVKGEYCAPSTSKQEGSKPIRSDPISPVCMKLLVTGDYIKVRLDTKSHIMYNNYFNKGKKPPLMEYLRALAFMGHSEETLNQVADTYKMWDSKEYNTKLDLEMERLWPSSKVKKASTVKKVLKAVKKLP
jgi:hypothetical protein